MRGRAKEIRDLFGSSATISATRSCGGHRRRARGQPRPPNILPIHDVNLWAEYPNVHRAAPARAAADQRAEEIPVELVFKYLLQTRTRCARRTRSGPSPGPQARAAADRRLRNVKVSDFVTRTSSAITRHPPDHVGMGNVAYMAPELYSDPMTSGPQGDIYALGTPRRAAHPKLRALADAVADQPEPAARYRRHLRPHDARLAQRAPRDGRTSWTISTSSRMDTRSGRVTACWSATAPWRRSVPAGCRGAAGRYAGRADGEDGDKKSSHRPYSFQQRRNKKI
jgi:serine/threonine protein kinase